MGNPLVDQGTLNRLIASIVIPDFPELNVTPSFLGDEAIAVARQGDGVTYIPTQTGAVTSPEPYQTVAISIHLLKTQFLSGLYEQQRKADSRIGEITVRSDTRAFPPMQFINCSIQSVGELRMNGKDAGYRITIMGYEPINNDLWNS
jgi:hypothetical protein